MKCVERSGCSGRENVERVAFGFGLEKLPSGANLHEFGGFVFYFFHRFEQFDSFGIALGETLFEIAAEAEEAAKAHEGVDVAPKFAESGAAPPSSGISIPASRRSLAVMTICCALLTSRPERPMASGLCC